MFDKYREKYAQELSRYDHNTIQHMQHYFEALNKSERSLAVRPERLKRKADLWSKRLQENARNTVELPDSVKCVLELENGMRWVQLKKKEAFEYEGREMGHCVSSYAGKNTTILSLRDYKNKPHCTIEVSDKKIVQLKGKGNSFVVDKYIPYVYELIQAKKYTVSESELVNLKLFGLSKIRYEYVQQKAPHLLKDSVKVGQTVCLRIK